MLANAELYRFLEQNKKIKILTIQEKEKITKKFHRFFKKIPKNSARIIAIKNIAFVLCNDDGEMKIFELK